MLNNLLNKTAVQLRAALHELLNAHAEHRLGPPQPSGCAQGIATEGSSQDIRTSGHPDVMMSGHPDVRTSRRPDVRMSRRPDVRMSGSFRIPGFQVSSFHGSPVPIPRFPGFKGKDPRYYTAVQKHIDKITIKIKIENQKLNMKIENET